MGVVHPVGEWLFRRTLRVYVPRIFRVPYARKFMS